MSTVQNIVDNARTNSHVTSSQVTDTDMVQFFNNVYQDMHTAIINNVNEDFFFEIWTVDGVLGQTNGEYPLPTVGSSSAGAIKVKQLSVKTVSTNIDYTIADEISINDMEQDWEALLTDQPTSDPIYYIADNSIFIAPNFTSDTVGSAGNKQIKLTGLKRAIDLIISSVETDILIPARYHYIMSLGMEQYIYRKRGLRGEAQDSERIYDKKKNEMLSNLSDRNSSPIFFSLPPTSNLEA